MKTRRVSTLLIAITLVLGLWAVPASAQPAGTLVVGLVAEPVNLDPPQVTDLNSNRVGRRIVETLVTFPDESTQVVPAWPSRGQSPRTGCSTPSSSGPASSSTTVPR
jgi:ABC-type oligopeptide transport system substrate-binding subunit